MWVIGGNEEARSSTRGWVEQIWGESSVVLSCPVASKAASLRRSTGYPLLKKMIGIVNHMCVEIRYPSDLEELTVRDAVFASLWV